MTTTACVWEYAVCATVLAAYVCVCVYEYASTQATKGSAVAFDLWLLSQWG